jgi:hypothetical protein
MEVVMDVRVSRRRMIRMATTALAGSALGIDAGPAIPESA